MTVELVALGRPTSPPHNTGRPKSYRHMLLKRIFDVFASSILIVALLPLMLVVAAMISFQDGRPILFGHRRIGHNGKTFRCWKFRTMVRDADAQLTQLLDSDPAARAEWDDVQKLKDDPRIIPGIGHFLRRSSLDEMPQLFNVLCGEMSMVGPRPIVLDELERYGNFQSHYMSVRPGLTGPWQVGERSDGDYEARVRKDVSYVENWSFAQDVRIIFKTVSVPFKGGAY